MSDFDIGILTCFTDVEVGIVVVASFFAAMVKIVMVASLVAAVIVIAIDKLPGATGAVVVAICAASPGGLALLVLSGLLGVRMGVVAGAD